MPSPAAVPVVLTEAEREPPSVCGGAGFWPSVWTGSSTSRVRAGRGRSPTPRSTRVITKTNDIRSWIETWNDDPKPYAWTKTANQIIESCTRINDARH
jgi:hypothetical protein